MEYDALQRKTRLKAPDRGTTAYTYDHANRLLTATDPMLPAAPIAAQPRVVGIRG